MGLADLEAGRRRGRAAEGGRQAGSLRPLADHDPRRILQVDRRRSGAQGARQGEHSGARVHRAPVQRQERPFPHCRRRRLLRSREPHPHLPLQGLSAGLRRRRRHLSAALGGRGHGARLVSGMECGVDLCDGGRGRRRADPDGKSLRAHPLQGWLWPRRRLVSAVQGAFVQRLRRELSRQEPR